MMFNPRQSQLDLSMDLGHEKGITLRARNAAFKYKDYHINIVDAARSILYDAHQTARRSPWSVCAIPSWCRPAMRLLAHKSPA